MSASIKYYGYPVRPVKNDAPATTGTAKAKLVAGSDTEYDVTWVQLWENGPKWATINVGVTNPEATTGTVAYGGMYHWCGTNNKRINPSASDDHDTGSSYGSTYDTAKNIWGSAWRMPTNTELSDLLSKCNCTFANGGLNVTGNGDYSSYSIFLPAAGYYISGSISSESNIGDYWSSTPLSGDQAKNLNFHSSSKIVGQLQREYGCCVRAVLAE